MENRLLLNDLKVGDVLNLVVENPSSIEPDAPLVELLDKILEDTRTRHVYVVDENKKLLGVVRMITVIGVLFPLQAIGAEMSDPQLFSHINLDGKTVREIMKSEFISVRLDTRLQDMAAILLKEKITELPVVNENNQLIGQVNMYEIIQIYLRLRAE